MGNENLTGTTLGQYELRDLLGSGGMGTVYSAWHVHLKVNRAIKIVPFNLSSTPGYLERFNREAEIAASLEHPHILSVIDFGIESGLSYVVMRQLTGGTLSQRMRQREQDGEPLPSLGEVSQLLNQMAGALDHAHTQGVIHRDVKASNIMFDNQGSAYLLDFGIAKLADVTSSLTGTGMAMGTPSHMAPEQWRNDDVSAATDQYALGIVIYTLVAGRVPFEAPTPYQLMSKHLNDQPTPPHQIRTDVPEALAVVLNRALAKRPQDRFPTVTAFAQAFAGAITGAEGKSTGFFTFKLRPQAARVKAKTPSKQQIPSSGSQRVSGSQAVKPRTRPDSSRLLLYGIIGLIAVLVAILAIVLASGAANGAAEPTSAIVLLPPFTPTEPTATLEATTIPTETDTATPDTVAVAQTLAVQLTAEAFIAQVTGTARAVERVAALSPATPTDTATATHMATFIDTATPTETATHTPTATETATELPTATDTATDLPTATDTATSAPTLDPNDPACRVQTTSALNMRSQPTTTNNNIITTLPSGAIAQVIGRLGDNSWWQVRYNFSIGWVSPAFTNIYGSLCSTVPIVPIQTIITPTLLTPSVTPLPTPLLASIVITSPTFGSVISGNVSVFGSAIHPDFLQAQLEYGPDPNFSNLWSPIVATRLQPVFNNVLGIWATNTVPDGMYQIRLRVFLRDGSQLQTIVNAVRVQNAAPTLIPSATPTRIRPTATRIPPTATPTRIRPTATRTQTANALVRTNTTSANLRSGPGTNYSVVGATQRDDRFTVVAKSGTGDSMWYLIVRRPGEWAWIWSGVVDLETGSQANIQVAATIPPAPVAATTSSGSGRGTSSSGGPKITSARSVGPCIGYYYEVSWETPGSSGKELRVRTTSGFVSMGISGGSGTTRWNNWRCPNGGCAGSFVVVDWDGRESPVAVTNVCGS